MFSRGVAQSTVERNPRSKKCQELTAIRAIVDADHPRRLLATSAGRHTRQAFERPRVYQVVGTLQSCLLRIWSIFVGDHAILPNDVRLVHGSTRQHHVQRIMRRSTSGICVRGV